MGRQLKLVFTFQGSPVMECQHGQDVSPEHGTKVQLNQCRPVCWISQARKPGTRKPDGPYAYFVCFCGFVTNLLAIGCSYSYGLLFPILLDEFKEGKARTGKFASK